MARTVSSGSRNVDSKSGSGSESSNSGKSNECLFCQDTNGCAQCEFMHMLNIVVNPIMDYMGMVS